MREGREKGLTALAVVLIIIWVAVAAGAALLVYRHSQNSRKPYAAPADASKLPKRSY